MNKRVYDIQRTRDMKIVTPQEFDMLLVELKRFASLNTKVDLAVNAIKKYLKEKDEVELVKVLERIEAA